MTAPLPFAQPQQGEVAGIGKIDDGHAALVDRRGDFAVLDAAIAFASRSVEGLVLDALRGDAEPVCGGAHRLDQRGRAAYVEDRVAGRAPQHRGD
ncbi:MAG TPA: hypothetical protein PL143_20605, partial [Rhodocyclaceae bacterium]|nr:hypothetical protein [Rhodocyclaceae bacterium]